jgi:hypothetical protein
MCGKTFIGPASRCINACTYYGVGANLTIPGPLGRHHVTMEWHRAGCHQLSCRLGKHIQARHGKFNTLAAELCAAAGAVVDPSETFISPNDNKRADCVLWHHALSDRGIAGDTTIRNSYTLDRLRHSATIPGYTLIAAEKEKSDKYSGLCELANLDFKAFAFNVQGGFGPAFNETNMLLWDAKKADAKRMGTPLRRIESQERRALEKFSAEAVKCFYRSVYINQNGRVRTDYAAPPPPDREDDARQLPYD